MSHADAAGAGHSPAPILVIGYGNPLRGDDAAGPRAGAAIASRHLPHVQVRTPQQLTPELAPLLASARLVIFIDAARGLTQATCELLTPAAPRAALHHVTDPRTLLALALTLYQHCPPAWLVRIPAQGFDLGAPLSPLARRGLRTAVHMACQILAPPAAG